MIDLQTIFSVLRDDPRFYNALTYLICGLLLLAWILVTLRAQPAKSRDFLALAAISVFSMLPTYHRPHDAKLLILTLPACAMLLAEGRAIGRVALVLNAAAIVITSDFPLAFLAQATRQLNLTTDSLKDQMLMILLGRPMPLVLLALAFFYLGVYAHRCLPATSMRLRRGHYLRDSC